MQFFKLKSKKILGIGQEFMPNFSTKMANFETCKFQQTDDVTPRRKIITY
jgi:hypothetical protein